MFRGYTVIGEEKVCVTSAAILTHHVEDDRLTPAQPDLIGGVARVGAGLAAGHVGELELVAAAHHPGGVVVHLQQLRGGRGLGEGTRVGGGGEGNCTFFSIMPFYQLLLAWRTFLMLN